MSSGKESARDMRYGRRAGRWAGPTADEVLEAFETERIKALRADRLLAVDVYADPRNRSWPIESLEIWIRIADGHASHPRYAHALEVVKYVRPEILAKHTRGAELVTLRTFAAYAVFDRRRDTAEQTGAYREARDRIADELIAAGWRRADVDGLEIDLSISSEHTIHTWQSYEPVSDLVVVLAEVRALELLNPNPFPEISVVSRESIAAAFADYVMIGLATIDVLFGWLIPRRRES